jgi:hypothetical protein
MSGAAGGSCSASFIVSLQMPLVTLKVAIKPTAAMGANLTGPTFLFE